MLVYNVYIVYLMLWIFISLYYIFSIDFSVMVFKKKLLICSRDNLFNRMCYGNILIWFM